MDALHVHVALLLGACSYATSTAPQVETPPADLHAPVPVSQITVPQVEKMKRLPRHYQYTDYAQMTIVLNKFLFTDPRAVDLGLFCVGTGQSSMYNGSSWAIPSYAGADRAPCDFQGPCPGGDGTTQSWEPGEGIPVIGALLSATLNGLDISTPDSSLNRSSQLDSAFLYASVEGLVGDHVGTSTLSVAGSNWYAFYPSIAWAHLASALPAGTHNRAKMLAVVNASAQLWPAVVQGFDAAPRKFNSTGFDFNRNMPVSNGKWEEQDVASGLAFLSVVTASAVYGNLSSNHPGCVKLVAAADTALSWLETWSYNPLYEVLGAYGPVAAARMNVELGRNYNVTKHLSWALGGGLDIESRYGWGVMADTWGDEDIGGLVGSNTDGAGYAFAGDTFWFVKAIAPLPRYCPEYARTVGKWMLNVAHSSKFFYAKNLQPDKQLSTASDGLKYDPLGVIAYEGLRKCDYNRTGLPHPHCEHGENFGPYGEADTPDWSCRAKGITPANGSAYAACERQGRGCTLGTYGGVFVGVLGRVITKTNVTAVLMVDALATDVFPTSTSEDDTHSAGSAHPTFTIYNPHSQPQWVEFNHSARSMPTLLVAGGFNLFDTSSGSFLARGCGGNTIPVHCGIYLDRDSAVVVAATPVGASVDEDDDSLTRTSSMRVRIGGKVVRW